MKKQYQNFKANKPTELTQYPYRKGSVCSPTEKRISRIENRPIASFSCLTAYATVPWRHYGRGPLLHFVFNSVAWKFFLPQFMQKTKLRHTPVKHVDHELDEKVPFRPDHLKIYMDFINTWIRPISMLVKRFGASGGTKLGAEFIRYLNLAYDEAYSLYRISFTTTSRPKTDNASVKRLRRADPHFMCVPSLHIAIMCLCIGFYKMLFKREHFTQSESDFWLNEIKRHATAIGESVLYLKQHSVNCIPAALYMMTRITPELFTPEDAVEFIDSLFARASDVKESDRKKINAHIHVMYERLLLEGCTSEDWKEPVLRWLKDYHPFTPSYAF